MFLFASCQNPLTETGYSITNLNHVEFNYDGANGVLNLRSESVVAPTSFDDHGFEATCSIEPKLPQGLYVEQKTCAIKGSPEELLLPTRFKVIAINAAGQTSASVTLSVLPGKPTLEYPSRNQAIVNENFLLMPSVFYDNESSITSCTVEPALPDGLILDNTNCRISGLPTVYTPEANYLITVTNQVGVTKKSLNLGVAGLPLLSFENVSGLTKVGLMFRAEPSTFHPMGDSITSCVASPELPVGFEIDQENCVISGIAFNALPRTNYTILATNAAGSVSATVDLEILLSPPSLEYESFIGQVYAPLSITPFKLQNGGTPITSCSISPQLPDGLSLHHQTCVISGTVLTESASRNYTITTTNIVGSASAVLNLEIEAVVPQVSFESAQGKMENPITITPSDFKNGGAPITGCETNPALPEGLSIDPVTCIISGTPVETSSATYVVTTTNSAGPGQTNLLITIGPNFPQLSFESASGTYDVPMEVRPSSVHLRGAPITRCAASPDLPQGLSLAQDSCVLSGTPQESLSLTTYTLTFANAGGENTTTVSLSLAPNIPVIDPYENLTGKLGGAFLLDASVRERGSALSNCTLSPSLPSGLSLDPLTCNISGTPEEISEEVTYTVIATNSAGTSAPREVSFGVVPNVPLVSFDDATGAMGDPLEVSPTVFSNRGSPITGCSISPELPSTLSFDSETCVISGTPLELLEETEYTVTATNAVGDFSTTLLLAVGPRIPFVNLLGDDPDSYPGTGTTWHSLVYSRPALLYGPTYTTAAGGGMNFDGVNDYAIISPSSTYTPFGLEFWVKVNCDIQANDNPACSASGKTHQSLGGWDNTAGVHLGGWSANATNEVISIISKDGKVTYLDEPLPIGFYHLFINWNGSHYDIWVNGEKKDVIAGTTGHASLDVDLAETFWLGTLKDDSSTSAYNFFGTLFEFRLWNSQVPDSEIISSFSSSQDKFVPTLSYEASNASSNMGVAMTVTPSTSNSVATSCTADPALPAGLSFSLPECKITGTPSVNATTTHQITATNNFGSTSASITINVIGYLCRNFGYDGPTTVVTSLSSCWYSCPARGYDGPSTASRLSSCWYRCSARGWDGPWAAYDLNSCGYNCRNRGYWGPSGYSRSCISYVSCPTLSQDYGRMTWNDAISFCQSQGGHLPSISELSSFYNARCNLGSGASHPYIWSSSENSTNYAWKLNWSDGSWFNGGKTYVSSVRCVFP